MFQPSVDEADFGEWPHVCALLKKEFVDVSFKISLCMLYLQHVAGANGEDLPVWSLAYC